MKLILEDILLSKITYLFQKYVVYQVIMHRLLNAASKQTTKELIKYHLQFPIRESTQACFHNVLHFFIFVC